MHFFNIHRHVISYERKFGGRISGSITIDREMCIFGGHTDLKGGPFPFTTQPSDPTDPSRNSTIAYKTVSSASSRFGNPLNASQPLSTPPLPHPSKPASSTNKTIPSPLRYLPSYLPAHKITPGI